MHAFLLRQLAAIGPKVIVCLGSTAAQNLLGTKKSISHFRGQWFDLHGAKVIATYHPAYLLRNPNAKLDVWIDLQKAMAVLGLSPQTRKSRASGTEASRRAIRQTNPLLNLAAEAARFTRCCYTSALAWPAIAKSPFLFRCARRLLTRVPDALDALVVPGARVVVPFRNRAMMGVVLERAQ